jgi:hypothetical protein
MASFHLENVETGIAISGYLLLKATPEEVNQANLRLAQHHSSFRYIKADSPSACATNQKA